jgi:aspartyl-tRNA synthetase
LGKLSSLQLDIYSLLMLGLLSDISEPHFLWVTEFPLFTRADEDKAKFARDRWSSTHHPFTAPMLEDADHLKSGDIEKVSYLILVGVNSYVRKVRGQHYDLVLNGIELGGGSVRVHLPEMQKYIFQGILKVSRVSHLRVEDSNYATARQGRNE